MNICVRKRNTCSDYDGHWVEVNVMPMSDDLAQGYDPANAGYEYLDTPGGTYRRHNCYSIHSPYGWEAVSWG
jgi:hypothetical protein